MIVTSATYRQASIVTPEHLAKDAENRLYARGPRLRLQAEFIRDQALAVSGLLNREIGGASVSPYQPEGLWEQLSAFQGKKLFERSTGDDLWRRSLYTYWKRTVPPPSMICEFSTLPLSKIAFGTDRYAVSVDVFHCGG